MRFGGHQTFTIRDGWLYKGLRLVVEDAKRFGDKDLADWLGVGKNMAKSIYHWLLATALAEKDPGWGGRTRVLRLTEFGKLVWERDRYFLLPGTWWAVHLHLVNHPHYAYSWNWFFNVFASTRFERAVCVDALCRNLATSGFRMPTQRTVARDVSCLLRSYSVSVPQRVGDPEDVIECPLSELGLLLHSPQTGFYHLDRGLKPIPYELFGCALALAGDGIRGTMPDGRVGSIDRSLTELAHDTAAPGRVFSLTSEALYELTAGYEAQGMIRLDGLAGERIVRIGRHPPGEWLDRYYDGVDLTDLEVA